VNISEIFDFDKIFSVVTDILSIAAIMLSFLGMVVLYRITRRAKSK